MTITAQELLDDELTDEFLAYPQVQAMHYFPHEDIHDQPYERWRSEAAIKRRLGNLQEFLDEPCIHDSFGSDHSSRRKWHATLPKELYELTQNDALRVNKQHVLPYLLNRLMKGYSSQQKDALNEALCAVFEGLPEDYNALPTEQKITETVALRTAAVNFARSIHKY